MSKINKLKELFEKLDEAIGETKKVVVKTVKMKPEWIKMHEACKKARSEAELAVRKHEYLNDSKWAKINADLDYPEYNLHINGDNIEFTESK